MKSGIPLRAAALSTAFLCACASPVAFMRAGYDFSSIRRVALLGFDDFPRQAGSGAVVASMFEKYLIAANYSVVERRQVNDVLKEHRLNSSGAVDPKMVKSLGKMLGVDALMLGSLTSFTPGRQRTVVRDQVDERQEPIVRPVTHRTQNPDGTWNSQTGDEVVGYNVVRTHRDVPQQLIDYAQAGIAVRMVDVKTAEVLWVGSDTETGYTLEDAADSVSRAILNAVKKTWPKP
jgi:curli biogenesis system outer membrane secretion channel CsgG